MEDKIRQLAELEDYAKSIGFKWDNIDVIIAQIISECHEIQKAISDQETQSRVHEEVGDLLHGIISLCFFMKINVDDTITKIHEKFLARIRGLEALAEARGIVLSEDLSAKAVLKLWQDVKKLSKDI